MTLSMQPYASFNLLPTELIVYEIFLPYLDLPSLTAVTQTCKRFAFIARDEQFWARKLRQDFNYNVPTARTIGWRKLYAGMSRADIYVWGADQKRLGLDLNGKMGVSHIPADEVKPEYLTTYDGYWGRIVEVTAGGWGFHATTNSGYVLAWGIMSPAFRQEVQEYPTRVFIPTKHPVRTLSCGRMHCMALTSNGEIWEWHEWHDFKRIIHDDNSIVTLSQFSSLVGDTGLSRVSPPRNKSGVKQISAGWHFSSILRHDHRVFIWSDQTPHLSPSETIIYDDLYMDMEVDIPFQESIIRYHMFELAYQFMESDPFSMIAAGDNFVIALTVSGQLYKHDILPSAFTDPSVPLPSTHCWQHLPSFCDLDYLLRLPVYIEQNIMPPTIPSSATNEYVNSSRMTTSSSIISHITAHFNSFIAYSSPSLGVVLIGSNTTTSTSVPTIIPSLQNRGIVKCTQGDWHHGAITDSGHLLVWGANNGGLGLGNLHFTNLSRVFGSSNVEEPVKVRFTQERSSLWNWGSKDESGSEGKYVIDASFGGWHSSAVVMDTKFLVKREEKEMEDYKEQDIGLVKKTTQKVMEVMGGAMDYLASSSSSQNFVRQ